jgi:peptidyl-prolyl cis-trans isomerase SurA
LESEFAARTRGGEGREETVARLHGLHSVRPDYQGRLRTSEARDYCEESRGIKPSHIEISRPHAIQLRSAEERLVKRLLTAVGIVAVALLANGCKKDTAPSPDVWATVNGHDIKQAEVEKYYRSSATSDNPSPSQEEALSLKLNVLDELINNEILMELAQKQSMVATDGEVEDKFTESKSPYTEEEFQRQLRDRGLTVDDFKQEIRRGLTIQKLYNREVAAKITVTDQDIADYFNQNRAQFNVSETQYKLAQILVTPRKDPQISNRKNDDATTDAEAKRKAAALLEKLNAGADFATLAIDYSEDPTSARNGGDVGYVPESALDKPPVDPALKKAVMSLKPGQISGVISLKDGSYNIIKLIAREGTGQRDLSDPQVMQLIRDTLHNRKDQLLRAAFLTVVRGNAKISNYLAQQIMESGGKLPAMAAAPKK